MIRFSLRGVRQKRRSPRFSFFCVGIMSHIFRFHLFYIII